MNPKLNYSQVAIESFCKRNHVRRLSLFGSVARGEDRPESDLDILVEFEPDSTPGFAFFGMADELEQIFKRKVDLNTPAFLSKHFRLEAQKESKTIYER